jgi:hypothetical protein
MKFKTFFVALASVVVLLPAFVSAQTDVSVLNPENPTIEATPTVSPSTGAAGPVLFKPMVGLPNINPSSDFNSYINALYVLSISIAALVAVVKIIIAGVKWMLTDIVTSKQAAKADIEGALLDFKRSKPAADFK